jgi:hypothetical protein
MDLTRWISETKENQWRPAPEAAVTDRHVFSDASSHGCAWAHVVRDMVVKGDTWSRDDTKNIFLAELDALCGGAQSLSVNEQEKSQFNTDNAALNFALKKGLSSSYPANVLLNKTFGHTWPTSKWIPSEAMPVDGWSRGEELPTLPHPLDARFRQGMAAAATDTAA